MSKKIRLTRWAWFSTCVPFAGLIIIIIFTAFVDMPALISIIMPFALGYAAGRASSA